MKPKGAAFVLGRVDSSDPPTHWLTIGFWLLAGMLALPWDVSISAWFVGDGLPGELRRLFYRIETYGHAYGMICIAITIYLLDIASRRHLPRLVASFIVAGLSANLVKIVVLRVRPRTFLEQSDHASTFLGPVWMLPEWNWATILDSAHHSTPSAHTAAAVAMSYGLSQMYPSGRQWFMTLALFCAMNRIDGGAHFVSDVCWGAALGTAVFCWLPTTERCAQIAQKWNRQRSAYAGNLVTSPGRTG